MWLVKSLFTPLSHRRQINMFSGFYQDWNQKRIKGIIEFYGHKFFYYKKVLDLGCGHADIAGAIYRLGADTTAVDARQDHLKIVAKKFPGIKTVKADMDAPWQFANKQFDLIIDLGLICHLNDFEKHLRSVCASTTHLILETAVCDSDDPTKNVPTPENKSAYDLANNGMGCRPSAANIERILTDCGMNFRRQDLPRYNSGTYTYDWASKNNGECNFGKRRLWFAIKRESAIQFANHSLITSVPPNIPNINALPTIHSRNIPVRPGLIKEDQSPSYNVPPSIMYATDPNSYFRVNTSAEKKKFVIVIPSYKNEKWCEQNINSALNQNYDNFRIIFTDDVSPDGTFDKVKAAVDIHPNANKCSLIKNTTRIGALENLYNMIYSCDDDEIILTLDGDDWLSNNEVLNILNRYYTKNDIWMTYGQYQNSTDGHRGVAAPIPANVIAANSFRSYAWCASHLRTFYTGLFKKIKIEDLKYKGKFMEMTWDFTIMFPMLEMSKTHSMYIPDILYVYNMSNPISDHRTNVKLQQGLDSYVRKMPRYTALSKPPIQKNIGLLLIATGKYDKFIQGLITSADTFFLNNDNVTYYIFTNSDINAVSKRNIIKIPIEHKPFPFASMDRFKHFTNNADKFSKENYLYYVDVDCLFVDNIGDEIIGNLVGVRHCGYYNKPGPFENNAKSCLYLDKSKYKYYFGGGFSGGTKDNYLELSRWCSEKIDKEVSEGRIPLWHDETAINKYFADHMPDVILSPSYHYPQGNIEYYKKMWKPQTFNAKILLLDKIHKEIRS